MSPERINSRVRRLAKSCAECRRRKIRCIWPLEPHPDNSPDGFHVERTACNRCIARGLTCLPQIQQARVPASTAQVPSAATPATSNTVREGTLQDRLGHLENHMASLIALVRSRTGRQGYQAASLPSEGYAYYRNNSHPPCVRGGTEVMGDESDHCSDLRDAEHPPNHLRVLFDDFNLDLLDNVDHYAKEQRQPTKVLVDFTNIARVQLQALLPSREAIQEVAAFASEWMVLYYSLFPAYFMFRSGEELISTYQQMRNPEVDPVLLTVYLVSLAITTQQLDVECANLTLWRGNSRNSFVDAVCRVVNRTVVENHALWGTAQGVEAVMLFIRLLLGRGNLHSTWVILRRVISIAEIIGLPRAQYEIEGETKISNRNNNPVSSRLEILKLRSAVWEAVCATDRNFGMMLNLPAATSRYTFPLDTSIWRNSHISAQAYNYQLSSIACLVFEIDELYMRGVPEAESYEKVLAADRRLRALAASASRDWWQSEENAPLADLMVKFWHCYITARVHLRPAMLRDDQYAYSRSTCLDACRNAIRRFPKFRLSTPSGFFVCRLLDLQAFTAASFLLLAGRSRGLIRDSLSSPTSNETNDLNVKEHVRALVQCFEQISNQPGSDFARKAINTINTLESYDQGNTMVHSDDLTFEIPMLGKAKIYVPQNHSAIYQQALDIANRAESDEPRHLDNITFSNNSETGNNMGIPNTPGIDTPVTISWNFEFENTPFWGMQDTLM